MRFCILASNKIEDNLEIKTRKPIFETNDLEEAVQVYESYIQQIRHKTLFLIADFEYSKKSFFRSSSLENDFEDVLPFFIIGQWCIGVDKDLYVRCDRTQVSRKGFTREFSNNLAAMRDFLLCIEQEKNAEFRVIYKKVLTDGNSSYDRIFNRKIASTTEMFCAERDGIYRPVRRFHLLLPDWEFVPLRKTVFKDIDLISKTIKTYNGTDNIVQMPLVNN